MNHPKSCKYGQIARLLRRSEKQVQTGAPCSSSFTPIYLELPTMRLAAASVSGRTPRC